MAKTRKVDIVALPVPVYNNLITFLQEIKYKDVAQLLQQVAGTMHQTTIRIEIPQEPEPEDDPASGDEATD